MSDGLWLPRTPALMSRFPLFGFHSVLHFLISTVGSGDSARVGKLATGLFPSKAEVGFLFLFMLNLA